VDPVQHHRDRIVIRAVWGLGAGVVDGSVSADAAWVRRRELDVAEYRPAEQSEEIALDPDGGTRRTPLRADRRGVPVLPEPWVQRVAQFAIAAEGALGRPQDIEWAIAEGQVWVLQSRPITALSPEMVRLARFPVTWNDEEDRRRLWTLEQPSGREDDALYPLELDSVAAVESMREETCRFLGADRNGKILACSGRVYFTPLPLDISEGDRRVRSAWREDLKERLWEEGRTAWEYWGPEIVRATKRLRTFDREDANGPALAAHLEDALGARRRGYMLHPILWFKPQPPYLAAYERVSGHAGPAAEAAAHRLLDSVEGLDSELADRLYAMACAARRMPAVAALISDPPPDMLDRLDALPEAGAFLAQLDELLVVYGERTGRGYGFEPTITTPTWREQPTLVLRLVRSYLAPDVEPPAAARARARQARDTRVDALCAARGDPEAAAAFRRQLATARRWQGVLSLHNHYADQMGLGQLRHAVLAAARWLVARGVLAEQEEVYWLYYGEILGALRSEPPPTLAGTIAARRARHAEWAQLEAPPILGIPQATLPERPAMQRSSLAGREGTRFQMPEEGERPLAGEGASPGRYRGRARVVLDVVAVPDLSPGNVLVAENASPRWTPFFPVLGAVVLDRGSIAQHAAATAREYGIPAVVHTRVGTRRIPDGAWVTVDGELGTVELEAQE
jgi:pyruvate,water dikinase